jgi:hypothetical protein
MLVGIAADITHLSLEVLQHAPEKPHEYLYDVQK